MSEYYDRKGQPMTLLEWGRALESDRCVAVTTLADGKLISTVWLGLDHSFGSGPPLIFETMVFPSEHDIGDLGCDRYSTEAEAVAGHAAMVEKWSKPGAER